MYVASIYFCKWQVSENLVLINFSLKEKRIQKRQFNQGIFSCFCQDQRKDRQVMIKKLLLLIDSKKAELTNIFWAHFFLCIYFRKYEFCVYLVDIYFQECSLKENCVYLILQNWLRFAKKICTQKLVHLR